MTVTNFNLPFPTDAVPRELCNVVRYGDSFNNDDRFAFEIYICRPWMPATNIDNADVRRFEHIASGATFEIRSCLLDKEVAPGDYLQQIILKGQRIDNRTDRYTVQGIVSDILSVDDQQSIVHRATCIKNGNCLIIVDCYVSLAEYEQVAEDFFIFTRTLRFRGNTVAVYGEPLTPFTLVPNHRDLLAFSLPSSWKTHEFMPGFEVECTTDRDNSKIRVMFLPLARETNEPSERFKLLLHAVKEKLTSIHQLHVGPAGILSARPVSGFDASCAVTYPVYQPNPSGADELSIVCHTNSRFGVCLTMLGPSRGRDPLLWAENKRAIELLNETLCLPNR